MMAENELCRERQAYPARNAFCHGSMLLSGGWRSASSEKPGTCQWRFTGRSKIVRKNILKKIIMSKHRVPPVSCITRCDGGRAEDRSLATSIVPRTELPISPEGSRQSGVPAARGYLQPIRTDSFFASSLRGSSFCALPSSAHASSVSPLLSSFSPSMRDCTSPWASQRCA